MAPMSNAPSDAVEGGDFPRGDLLVVSARFGIHAYVKKGVGTNPDGTPVMIPVIGASNKQAVAIAAFVDLRNDEGVVFNQFYSIGDPSRFTVAADGSEIDQGTLKTNCNYFQLLSALTNAGYPENKLRDESKIANLLVGLYAKFDQEQTKRGDSSQLVLPQEIHQFPWGEATQNAPKAPDVAMLEGSPNGTPASAEAAPTQASASASAPAAAPADDDVIAKVVEAAFSFLDEPGDHKRDDLAMYIFSNYGSDEKMGMMNAVTGQAATDAMSIAGITLTGEVLSLA